MPEIKKPPSRNAELTKSLELRQVLTGPSSHIKGVNGWYSVRCPAHDDRKASLSFAVGADGAVRLKCFAGCSTEAVLAKLGGFAKRDLFPASRNGQAIREAEAYGYVDEKGRLLFQVVRFEPKDFRQRRPDGKGGWDWQVKGVRQVPYRLPELLAAVVANRQVFVVEGEKDCNALVRLGLVTTTNAGGAGKWRSEFAEFLTGAHVAIIPDADEPGRRHANQVAESLDGKAKTLKVVELPEGKDVSEWLEKHLGRKDKLLALCKAAKPWIKPAPPRPGSDLAPIACQNWQEVLNAWRRALKWRQCLSDVFAVMLSVALSTEQIDDQLFLQVIGEAGSAKTRLCDAMLVSKTNHPLEHLTGFHSGWGKEGDDYSLLDRINRKCLITPEGDVLMSSPRFTEIMSQQRRIFDGTSGASYKNRKEDMRYTGLRTPWIIAGTPALMETDQSRLGDRFLRVYVDEPTPDEEWDILLRAGHTANRSILVQSNCKAEGQLDADTAEAFRLSGGYNDWLRVNASKLLTAVTVDEEKVIPACARLAQFTASLRARPNADPKKDAAPSKEMPTRLTKQFVRLARCLAVVLGRPAVDAEALRVVRKVALDTARGRTLDIVRKLLPLGRNGMFMPGIVGALGITEERTKTLMFFLKHIGVIEPWMARTATGLATNRQKWRLTEKMMVLAREIVNA